MKKREATLDEWRNLYEVANEFKELGCWDWMYDIDLFGVQDIDTDEVGYCCIMGNGGEVFGVNVYLGDIGLKSYMDTLYQTVPHEDMAFIQKCLILNFEDRESLDKNDLEIIKKLELKFRGKKQWPQFRNYKPGYFPYYLDAKDVKYMTCVMEQVIDVAIRCEKDKSIVEPEEEDEILVRVPYKSKGEIYWDDEYMSMEFEEEDKSKYEEIDELALKRIKDSRVKTTGIWEADFFHAPAMVKDSERPYYPLVFIVADGEEGTMLDMVMTADFEGYVKEFQEAFMQIISKSKVVPETIVVRRKIVYDTLEPITKRIGIKIHPVEELVVIHEFRKSLDVFL